MTSDACRAVGANLNAATRALLAGLAALWLAGCASAPDRHYTLASPLPVGQPATATTGSIGQALPMAIDVAPVAVPERLARPQMVVRRSAAAGAEVRVLEGQRWASSFEQEMRDALAAGVTHRLGAIDVSKTGRSQGQPAWRIVPQVQAFEVTEGVGVNARMYWRLRRPDGAEALSCVWSAEEGVGTGSGMEALAQAGQRIASRAAETMARQIRTLESGGVARCD